MGWFVFLVLSALLFHLSPNTFPLVSSCNHDDASSLLSIKSSFSLKSFSYSNPWYCDSCYPKIKSWENGTNCCLWDGVSCDTRSGRVTGLDLSCSCLVGYFHPNNSLFKLTHLGTLNLAYNDFRSSQMPSGFGDLVSLTHLNLSHSMFSGVIPSKISHLSKLVSLDLSWLDGIESKTLEKLIVNATDLSELTLDDVDMSSVKPSSLSLLQNISSSLVSLSLPSTGLQGKLPNNILSLPNLQNLDLSDNRQLEGEFPNFNWSTPLRHLDLSWNNFSGEVPLSLSNLHNLTYIDLSVNNFEGPILQNLVNIKQLNCLMLYYNKFTGEIPSFLFDNQQLTYLDLTDNNFSGEIPDLFGKLNKLEILSLSVNNLVGQLPSSLFGLTKLRDFRCVDNKLVGSIPDKISGLSDLEYLDLSGNSLNGTIPHWCFSLSSLSALYLFRNQLSGPIPEFSPFSNLDSCGLSYNKLQGNIPNSMFLLQNLTGLMLSSNNLSGLVEFNKFSNLQFLSVLDLSYNNFLSLNFNGGGDYTFPNLDSLYLSSCNINSFPKFLSRLKNLRNLDLSQNQIHGRIPKWFNNTGNGTLDLLDLTHNFLTSVGYLTPSWRNIDLSFNMLEGNIPVPTFATQFFSVSNNKLTGHISSTICNASSLEMLNLSDNKLTGNLPRCLGTLPQLSVLDLQRNNLRGIIPRTYLEIQTLETMNFNGNQLEGPLPRSVIKCKQLRVLDLGENNIQDAFPCWLESLQQLQVLVLRANRFNGTINCFKSKNTFPMLRVFDISNNNFRGNLPTAYIENFKGMMVNVNNGLQYMKGEFNSSSYNDSVVVTIKGHTFELERILTTFTSIDLSSNRFEGLIPAIIGELKSLKGLNLSHNRITGLIPQTIGGLENLEWLDLSSNMLRGKIPMALTNLHFLSFLNLSQNHLVGMIPTGKQFNTFQNDSFGHNPGLCGLPLSKTCHKDEKKQTDSAAFEHNKQFGFGWKSVAIGYACGGVFGTLLGYIIFFIWQPQWSLRFVEGILNQRVRKNSHKSNANRRRQNQRR